MQKRYWLKGGIVLGIVYILCFVYFFQQVYLGGNHVIQQVPQIVFQIETIAGLVAILPAIAGLTLAGFGGNVFFVFLGGLVNLAFYFLIGVKLGGYYEGIKNRNTESSITEPPTVNVISKLRKYVLLIVIILILWKIFSSYF